MKIICCTEDKNLINSLSLSGQFDEILETLTALPVQVTDNKNENQLIILLDGNAVEISDIEKIKYETRNIENHMFYIIPDNQSNSNINQINFYCFSKDISVISPGQSPDQIVQQILKQLKPDSKKSFSNVICFIGTHSGVGATTITLEVAFSISSMANVSIGVLSLNSNNPGDLFIENYNGLYLDEIKSLLNSRLLTENQLSDNMFSYKGFKYLAGNRDIKSRLYYTPEEVNYLIKTAKGIFDLVFVDAGCQFDNALTVQSLICSDLKMLITNQSQTGLRNWQFSFEQIIEPLGYSPNDFAIILNKYKEHFQFMGQKNIQSKFKIPVMQCITDIGDMGIIAEEERCLPSSLNVKEYNNCIEKLSRNLMNFYGIVPKAGSANPKKRFFDWIFLKRIG